MNFRWLVLPYGMNENQKHRLMRGKCQLVEAVVSVFSLSGTIHDLPPYHVSLGK